MTASRPWVRIGDETRAHAEIDAEARRKALARPEANTSAVAAAREIVDAVIARGDEAVRDRPRFRSVG